MEEYRKSRWEFTKKRSRWHFDNSRPAEAGLDSYIPVCNFQGDFEEAIAEGYSRVEPVSWVGKSKPYDPDKLEVIAPGLIAKDDRALQATRYDFEKMNADASIETYDRAVVNDISIFAKLAETLGFKQYEIKFHNQRTGQMITQHVDNFYEDDFLEGTVEPTTPETRRYIVFLADWKLGQFVSMGNAMVPPWKAGDAITWSVRDMPHGTANTGWDNRPLLVITGEVTKETEAVANFALNEGTRVINLDD